MKTVFIQPPDMSGYKVLRDLAGRFGVAVKTNEKVVYPPLDFAYAAALIEKNGYDVEIIDAPAQDLNVEKILQGLLDLKPDLTVINTSIASLHEDLKVADLAKRKMPDTYIAVTGSFVSAMPAIALDCSSVDIVVKNEIEYTILDLTQIFEKETLENIKGIAYKKNGAVVQTQDRSLVVNLDDLPFPAYHRLPVNQYCHPLLPEKPFLTMLTSRGCPYGCIYCPYPIGYGDFWRGRTPENVLAEIQCLVDKFHVKSIFFRDQVFTFDMKRTEEICKGIVERGIDIKWRCETRVDKLSKKLMVKMKEAGCVGLHLGVESGDPDIFSRIGKKGVDINMMKKTFADAKDLEIKTGAFFMIGLPGETKQSVWRSYKLFQELDPDLLHLAIVTPYPGTELYKLAEKKGWILTRDWSKYTGFDVVMRTDDLSKKDIIYAWKYWNSSSKARNTRPEDKAFSRGGIKKALLNPSKAAKWVLRKMKFSITNPQKKFENWALEK